MTQENKDLLLKDLCARLPYGVKVSIDDTHFIGKNDVVLSHVDVADFIKDRMLDTVKLENNANGEPILVLTSNSSAGKETITVNVKDYLPRYDFCKDIPYKITLVNSYRILLGVTLGYVKPYLFPLSSMTEEQKREFDISMDMGYAAAYNAEVNCANKMIDFFNKNHFDYRGLIPMGLAIDATGKDIY